MFLPRPHQRCEVARCLTASLSRSKKVIKATTKRNPLRNMHAMLRLNPYSAVVRQAALGEEKKAADLKAKRATKVRPFCRRCVVGLWSRVAKS